LTVVADAPPVIVFVVVRGCLRSKNATEFAAIVEVGTMTTLSREIVAVADEAAVLAIAMFVTT